MIFIEHFISLYVSFAWLSWVIFFYLVLFLITVYLANRKRLNWWFKLNSGLVCFILATLFFDYFTKDLYLSTFFIRLLFYPYSLVVLLWNMVSIVSFDIAVNKYKLKFDDDFLESSEKIENLLDELSEEVTNFYELSATQREIYSERQDDLDKLKEEILSKKDQLEQTDVHTTLEDFFQKHGLKRTTTQTVLHYVSIILISFFVGLASQYTFEVMTLIDPEALREFQSDFIELGDQLRESPNSQN
jgi:hypothetical protein